MTASLKLSRDGRLLRARLNRPEKRNALNLDLCRGLLEAFSTAVNDPAIGAVLVEAEGDAFCAGMDLDEALASGGTGALDVHESLFTAGASIHKPIIAAVKGAALAGGTGLVANAHVVIAAQGATFGLTEIRIGLWPLVVYRAVASAVGERRALELSLTGRIFGTAEAVAWGLVHEVAPPFEFEDRALAIARTLAGSSAGAIRLGFEYVTRSRGMSAADAGRLALELRKQAFESDDFREGVNAFREKRKPRWPSL